MKPVFDPVRTEYPMLGYFRFHSDRSLHEVPHDQRTQVNQIERPQRKEVEANGAKEIE